MEKKSILRYFFFGTSVRYLIDIGEGAKISKPGFTLDNINYCLNYLDELGLNVTKIASLRLMGFRDKIAIIEDDDAKLSSEQSAELREICLTLRQTLEAELETHEAFIVTSKRFDTDRLLDDIGSLMSPGVFALLPEITQYDLSEAGKCIAFERPTAAAFHLLRGTEAVLRHFYCTLILRQRVRALLWGDMTQDLRNRRRTLRYTTLYNNLDNIRHSYRNPTQHPDAIYDIHEVQDLCPLCFEVINRMIKILKPS